MLMDSKLTIPGPLSEFWEVTDVTYLESFDAQQEGEQDKTLSKLSSVEAGQKQRESVKENGVDMRNTNLRTPL